MPYRRHLREVFSDTFEVYLRIIRTVYNRVIRTFGWGGPDWRVKHACTPCTYVVSEVFVMRLHRFSPLIA